MAGAGVSEDRGISKRKLLIFYPTLAVIAAVVVSIAISAGQGVHPQKSIAGGYDASVGGGLERHGHFVQSDST